MSELEQWLEERIAAAQERSQRTLNLRHEAAIEGLLTGYEEVLEWIRTHESGKGGE